ncbi:hypothetical protein L3Q82_011681, partial [Scortum barcoo]
MQRKEHAPLSINGTTVERVNSFRFPLGSHQRGPDLDSSTLTLSQSQPDSRLFFFHRLWRLNMDSRILCSFYRCTIESILTGCITAWRDPTTERHGGFDLLRFRPGPVHPSLDDLVVPGSPRSTISIPNLVRTPDRHSPLQLRAPELKRSASLSLP